MGCLMTDSFTTTGAVPHLDPSAIQDGVSALVRERDEYLAKAKKIDETLNAIAKMLGGSSIAAKPLMQLVVTKPPYEPDPNTMGGRMVQILAQAENGFTRLEMRAELAQVPKFHDQIESNINAFYNTVLRYIKKGRIKEVGGRLYSPDRAPDGERQKDNGTNREEGAV